MISVTALQLWAHTVCSHQAESVNDFVSRSGPRWTFERDTSDPESCSQPETGSNKAVNTLAEHTSLRVIQLASVRLYWDPGRSNNRSSSSSTFPAVLSGDFYHSKHYTLHYQNTVFTV